MRWLNVGAGASIGTLSGAFVGWMLASELHTGSDPMDPNYLIGFIAFAGGVGLIAGSVAGARFFQPQPVNNNIINNNLGQILIDHRQEEESLSPTRSKRGA